MKRTRPDSPRKPTPISESTLPNVRGGGGTADFVINGNNDESKHRS
jgi:hypothetical protein